MVKISIEEKISLHVTLFFQLSHLLCLCILCRRVVLQNAFCKQEELSSELILYLSSRKGNKSVADDISRARKTTVQRRII